MAGSSKENVDAEITMRVVEDFFGNSSDLADEWLNSQIPALGNKTPSSLIQCGKFKEVLDLIDRLKKGDFGY